MPQLFLQHELDMNQLHFRYILSHGATRHRCLHCHASQAPFRSPFENASSFLRSVKNSVLEGQLRSSDTHLESARAILSEGHVS